MEASNIARNKNPLISGQPQKGVNLPKRRSSINNIVNSQRVGSSEAIAAHGIRSAPVSPETIHLRLNSVAKGVRFANRTMETIETYIDRMKVRLKTILKQYPPFPPGSEERVKLLRAFNAFRKQIDQLTIPPKEEFAMRLMADPAVVSEAGDWDVILGDKGQSGTIHGRQVNTGSQGLNIPEIPEDATDDEVYVFLENLLVSGKIIKQRQAGLAEDAMIIGQLVEGEDSGVTSEGAAELKSLELRDMLRAESSGRLTDAQPQLMGLLK